MTLCLATRVGSHHDGPWLLALNMGLTTFILSGLCKMGVLSLYYEKMSRENMFSCHPYEGHAEALNTTRETNLNSSNRWLKEATSRVPQDPAITPKEVSSWSSFCLTSLRQSKSNLEMPEDITKVPKKEEQPRRHGSDGLAQERQVGSPSPFGRPRCS